MRAAPPFFFFGACVLLIAGKKKKKGGDDSTLGLVLIGFSLVMDAVTGGLQDKVKKRTKELNPEAGEKPVPTMHESMLWTNFSVPHTDRPALV